MNIKFLAAASSSVICAFGILNAQIPDYQNIKLPPGYKEQMEKMQKQALKNAEQALKNAGMDTDESSLTTFVKKIKTIRISEDTSDDVIRLLGNPKVRSKIDGNDCLSYSFVPGGDWDKGIVNGVIIIGPDGKVSNIKVTRNSKRGSEEFYSVGSQETKKLNATSLQEALDKNQSRQFEHFPLKETAPENPTEGQIYFNRTDKHFYGWDGTSWLKLDSKP